MKSKLERKKIVIPTYPVGSPEPLPIFFEKRPYQGASGKIYPIPYISGISDEKVDKAYDGIVLENDYITVTLLPEIGGKIHSAVDKTDGYEFVYGNKVIKPAMIGLAGPWVSGGIEFNYPQHHRPTTFMPADVSVGENGGEKYAYMGELDYFLGMNGTVKVSVDDVHSYIKAEVTVYNGTPVAHPFMWWANLAVEIGPGYKVVFPPDAEFVNDHDRRAVVEWPVAKGVYATARPFDYGDGTDIHGTSDIYVPTSLMLAKGQSDADHLSGYDTCKNGGIVAVADRHIAPGKKLWTWGNSPFGAKWCANLTDDGSRYVELMTGCYTDNQPDFTYIAPYETKTFVQYWYPIRDVGEVKSANIEAAVNLERRDGGIFVGVYSTSARKNCRVVVRDERGELFAATADISPDKPFVESVAAVPSGKATVTVTDEKGETIVSYTEYERGKKKPIAPRPPAADPRTIATVEELYLNGRHLMQYKHFNYRPEDYFLEGIRRDEGDARCNAALGELAILGGDFRAAEKYLTKAIERLTLRNANPVDTEPYYLRALARFATGDLDGAYDDAFNAVWSYKERSAGYYLLAQIEALKGNREKCVSFLDLSLETNSRNAWAVYIRGLMTGDKAAEEKTLALEPLFFAGGDTEKNATRFAAELMRFGLFDEAKKKLAACRECATKYYWSAYLARLTGDETAAENYVRLADACPWECEFPAGTDTMGVLENIGSARANYYLGCIFYDRDRYEDACAAWEKTVAAEEFAPAYRALAIGYFDHLGKKVKARACLEKAFRLYPESGRIFYELTMFYKSICLPVKEQLAFFKAHEKLALTRDDCTLRYSVLLTDVGELDRADALLKGHRFHTYEGGEGNLTGHHAWLHYLKGTMLAADGRTEEAENEFRTGIDIPMNYGEEKNCFVNEAQLYYGLALCAEKRGDAAARDKFLASATHTMEAAPTVQDYFRCLAYAKLNDAKSKRELADSMIAAGKQRLATADVAEYYGVGSPTYPPFGYDHKAAHELNGHVLAAFGHLAKGERAAADAHIAAAAKIDVSDFSVVLYETVAGRRRKKA